MIRSIIPLSLLFSFNLVACGEKDTGEEEETEDYSEYCDGDPEGNLIAEDGDCDGALEEDDCDDENPDSTLVADDGDCDGTITEDDCDDNDAESLTTAEDGDCDGFITNDDCDDNDAGSTIIAEDADCDGTITEDDCDDGNPDSTIIAEDGDCDGTLSAEDCDDANPSSTIIAEDADCDTYLSADDCDDSDPNAFPGAGENEYLQLEGLCYSDADGDGYGDSEVLSGTVNMECYLLEMVDSFGDGWTGSEIEVFEDGLSMGVYSNSSSADAGESQWEQHCLLPGTASVEFVFDSGMFSSEVYFSLYYDNGRGGELIASGEGTGSDEIIFDGATVEDGFPFYSEATPLPSVEVYGADCDDADAAVNPGVDDDSDGFSACDDCDDADADINPDAEDEWYDGIDSDCAGNSDYDYDGDGYDSPEYSGTCSDTSYTNQWDCEEAGSCSDTSYTDQWDCEDAGETWTSAGESWTATGTDCDDDAPWLHPLVNEADPTACYEDSDGDGWGATYPWSSLVIEGSDCYDDADYIYPGAAYNEPDVDGDGTIDCTEDFDGDGWGHDIAVSFHGTVAGTDCDDGDELIAPDVDGDGDGVDICNDCDDEDAAQQGGIGYYDYDGDGYGDQDDSGSLTCDFTTDDDGNGAPDYTLDNTDCDDDDSDINPGIDSDGDGADSCNDCDDEDASAIGQEAYEDDDGDGFGAGDPEWVCALDVDGDGEDEYSLTAGDCYDSMWSSVAAYVYPGAAFNEPDIDGDGIVDCTEDSDEDGWANSASWYADINGTDCNDDSADLNWDDLDGDGYSTCEDTNGLSDCNDDDATTYPGAAYNEPDFDATDYSTYECLTDGDGDGYGYMELSSCYVFALEDTYGDGWNGGMNIEVFEDGVSAGTATISVGGSFEETTICVTDGAAIEFVFNEGSWASEIGGEILGIDGSSLGTISGSGGNSGSQELYFDGGIYLDGETFYTETAIATAVGGSDSDDSDAAVH